MNEYLKAELLPCQQPLILQELFIIHQDYKVSLRAFNSIQDKSKVVMGYITVIPKLLSDFTASKTLINVGETINFTNLSQGNPSTFEWTFQGGTPASSVATNPSGILYNTAGKYLVSLKVTNATQNNIKTINSYITVNAALAANFTATKSEIVEGQSIDFTDLSQGNPVNWKWSFVGASRSTDVNQNPLNVVYLNSGRYDVGLSVSANGRNNSITKPDFITVYPLLKADFTGSKNQIKVGESISYQSLASGNPESFQWTFQGGVPSTSNVASPTIFYTTPGEYAVSLKVMANVQTSTETKNKFAVVSLITDVDELEKFDVYPNPSDGSFIVKGSYAKYTIELYNSLGC